MSIDALYLTRFSLCGCALNEPQKHTGIKIRFPLKEMCSKSNLYMRIPQDEKINFLHMDTEGIYA